jgi:hypothetical protein
MKGEKGLKVILFEQWVCRIVPVDFKCLHCFCKVLDP